MENTINQILEEGIGFHKKGNLKDALRCYNKVLEVNPKNADANHNIGILGLGVGKPEHALPFFKSALETNPNSKQFWESYINALLKSNRNKEANTVLNKAKLFLGKGENFTHLEEILGKQDIIYATLNDNKESEKKVEKLITLYNNRKYEDVLYIANKELKKNQTSVMIYKLIGASYLELKKFDLAIENFQVVIKMDPTDASIFNNIGVAQFNLGQLKNSIKSYNYALEIDNKYVPSYINLGNVYKDLNNLRLSAENFKKAIDLQPDNANLFFALSVVLQLQHDTDGAILTQKKGVLLNPSFEAELRLAEMLLKKTENLQEALIYIHKALEKKPMDATANAYKIVVLRGLKEFKKVNTLINFSDLIKTENIQNFCNNDISIFNKNLLNSLISHPRRAKEKNLKGWAIRGGTVIRNLFEDKNYLVQTFEDLLRRAIDKNIANLPSDPKHPFLMKKPNKYRLDCWVNFLEEGDFQSNHIHNNGWMSGVYYVDVPKLKSEGDKAGWIEFNRVGYELPHFGGEKGIKAIKPENGMFIFFPSYIWHGTKPFRGNQNRVSISFDVVVEK